MPVVASSMEDAWQALGDAIIEFRIEVEGLNVKDNVMDKIVEKSGENHG